VSKIADLVYERKQFIVPYNGKIADITHNDIVTHLLTLANAGGTGAIAGETRKIITVIVAASRISGTGAMYFYPNEGTNVMASSGYYYDWQIVIIKDGTQRLQYKQSVANDDWDLYCSGYVVEA